LETLYFTIVAVGLYFLADWLLNRLETRAGRRFEYRSIYFLFILGALALGSFALIRHWLRD
jgi:hypothetical protein